METCQCLCRPEARGGPLQARGGPLQVVLPAGSAFCLMLKSLRRQQSRPAQPSKDRRPIP